jgi:hypothetical protein
MTHEQYLYLEGLARKDFLAGHKHTLAALAFIRAAVPLLRNIERYSERCSPDLDALIATFPDDFPKE